MKRTKICHITESAIGKECTVAGWVKTLRVQKNFAFLELNDGSTQTNLQVILDEALPDYAQHLSGLSTGASVAITGMLVKSPGQRQPWELKASVLKLFGTCSGDDYPLQKKRHSFEFLRTIAHLRPRTNTQGAVLRVRNALLYATHRFFQERGFLYVQTPIVTASDCEGAGEQFLVTTLDVGSPPRHSDGSVDFTRDFFGKPVYLTVSGQLNAEALACALSDVYTFGPTFRAENSHTSRHLSEFWMLEPELAFADLEDDIACAEEYLKYVISYVCSHCPQEIAFFDAFIEKGLRERLKQLVEVPFARMTYTEAIEVLKRSQCTFEFAVEWGNNLQSEHERYLAEEYCKRPIVVTDYPERIKAFYMRSNDDGKTVAAMDVLAPKIGEIIGGSQREERLEPLKQKMVQFGLRPEEYWWYLQLRQYGTVPHAGFGVGFERLVLLTTGLENIRDAIPFPRFPGNVDF